MQIHSCLVADACRKPILESPDSLLRLLGQLLREDALDDLRLDITKFLGEYILRSNTKIARFAKDLVVLFMSCCDVCCCFSFSCVLQSDAPGSLYSMGVLRGRSFSSFGQSAVTR